MNIKIFTAAILLAILPAGAMAFDASKISLNGFVSQGYLDSSKNSFLDPTSIDGTYQLNEVGLTVSANVNDKLRIGVQLLSRDLGQEGNNEVVLDWAFGDYRINNLVGVRAGKIKMPMGLYNEGRDSDMLRDMVFLPQSIYDETWRSFMGAAMGVGLYGNIALGDFGDLDYQVMTGEVNIADDVYLVQVGLVDDIEAQFTTLAGVPIPLSKFTYENDKTAAASLVYNTPVDGLRVGVSYLDVQGSFTGDVAGFASLGPISMPFEIEASIKDKTVASVEYVNMIGSIRGEYMQVRNDISGLGQTFLGNTAEGYYVLGAVPVADTGLTLSALYDVYYTDKDNTSEVADNSFRKDMAIGARYNVTPNWILKAEYHDVEGTALFLSEYNPTTPERDWSYFVAKSTFFF